MAKTNAQVALHEARKALTGLSVTNLTRLPEEDILELAGKFHAKLVNMEFDARLRNRKL